MAKKKKSALRDRQKANYQNKDTAGFGGKRILDVSSLDDVEWYKPKAGKKKNVIDIIPYLVTSKNHPTLDKDDEDYLLDVWVHKRIGPGEDNFVCLKRTFKQPCPICEEADALKDSGADEEVYKALWPKHRCFYNVIDVKNPDEGIQIFEESFYLFEKEVLDESSTDEDGEYVDFVTLEDGHSVQFRAKEETFGKATYFKFKNFSFIDRDEIEESILEETYPLDEMLNIPTYEEVKNLYFGIDDEEDGDEDNDKVNEKPEPERKKKTDKKEKSDKKKSKTKCPHGYDFGEDCEDYGECSDDCEVWEECSKAK